MTFDQRLKSDKPVILDGALGSALEARGISCELPLWSAAALLTKEGRAALRALDVEYAHAGAEILTADTFRTNVRTLKKEGLQDKAKSLTQAAVDEVRFAIEESHAPQNIYIAGCVGPVEDCYQPEMVPPDSELYDEHHRHIDNLYNTGVNIVFLETMNTIREAVIALNYARETGLPVLVSFVCVDEEHILSGEPLYQAVERVESLGANAVLVNCGRPEVIGRNLEVLKQTARGPIGAYANVMTTAKHSKEITPSDYAEYVKDWVAQFHVKIVGGCCGTTPQYISKIAQLI